MSVGDIVGGDCSTPRYENIPRAIWLLCFSLPGKSIDSKLYTLSPVFIESAADFPFRWHLVCCPRLNPLTASEHKVSK